MNRQYYQRRRQRALASNRLGYTRSSNIAGQNNTASVNTAYRANFAALGEISVNLDYRQMGLNGRGSWWPCRGIWRTQQEQFHHDHWSMPQAGRADG